MHVFVIVIEMETTNSVMTVTKLNCSPRSMGYANGDEVDSDCVLCRKALCGRCSVIRTGTDTNRPVTDSRRCSR